MNTLPPETVRRIEDAAAGNLNPTNDQVRQHLGDGSLSHISPVIRAFRARQGEHLAADLKEAREDGRPLQAELRALARNGGKVKK